MAERKRPLVPRRTKTEIRDLARQIVTREVLVTDQPHVIQSAFYLILAFTTLTKRQSDAVGAVIGFYSDVVPGRGMNGYPIFTSVAFLHRNDVDALNAEVDQMRQAIA